MRVPPWLRLPPGVRWSPMLGIGVASALVLGFFGLWAAIGLLGSLFTFGSGSDPSSSLADPLKRHEQLAEASAKRFNGRSAFFMPSPPVRKPPKPTKPAEPPPPPPPPPPPAAPREYAGPKPIGAIGDLIFFADQTQLRVGEERGGVKVLASAAPWSVRLAHGGGEYDVELWTKGGKEPFFNNSDWRNARTSTPGVDPVGSKPDSKPSPGGQASSLPPSAPVGGRGPGMRDMAAGAPTPPEPQLTAPGSPSGPPMVPPPGAKAPTASQSPWTGDHMAPPPPLTREQIAGMNATDAEAAYRAVGRAKANRNLDDPTRQRLNQEFEQLSNRIKELGKGQSPPP
ncbi:MAG: hypothetical protein ACOYMI_07935 [Phycisphaerales bacterium]